MSKEKVADVLQHMLPNERLSVGPSVEDETILPLGYRSGHFEVAVDDKGAPVLKEVDMTEASKTASLDTAASTSIRKYDLYMSIYVGRTSYTGAYEYLVETYFDWRAGIDHMNRCNTAKDHLGVAWANNRLSAGSRGTQSGKYWHTVLKQTSTYALNIQKTDQSPNVGASWEFNEWKPGVTTCDFSYGAEWGRSSLYLRSTTYRNLSTDFVAKYFHTWDSANYTISFSGTPQVSISPTTDQWPAILAIDINT